MGEKDSGTFLNVGWWENTARGAWTERHSHLSTDSPPRTHSGPRRRRGIPGTRLGEETFIPFGKGTQYGQDPVSPPAPWIKALTRGGRAAGTVTLGGLVTPVADGTRET